MSVATTPACELCANDGGNLLLRNDFLRIVAVDDPHYPGFCRVILNRHEQEMTDLAPAEQQRLMTAVFAVEGVVRQLCAPDKINLASFGNMVPHVHWHIIPRWRDDRHFPNPVWGEAHREGAARPAPDLAVWRAALAAAIE